MFTTRDNVNTESTQLTISSTPIPGLVHLEISKLRNGAWFLWSLYSRKKIKPEQKQIQSEIVSALLQIMCLWERALLWGKGCCGKW